MNKKEFTIVVLSFKNKIFIIYIVSILNLITVIILPIQKT